MNRNVADIEPEEGEEILWQGAPQCRVSPLRWWYLFPMAAACAIALAASFTGDLNLDTMGRVMLGLFGAGCALAPPVLARRTNSAQYLITNRRVIIHAREFLSCEQSIHLWQNAFDCKLEPLHNGLAALSFIEVVHKRFGKRDVSKVLLYGIPAPVAEALYKRLGD